MKKEFLLTKHFLPTEIMGDLLSKGGMWLGELLKWKWLHLPYKLKRVFTNVDLIHLCSFTTCVSEADIN
jgi:hypothetical protein